MPGAGVQEQTILARRCEHALGHGVGPSERRLGRPIGDELDPDHEPEPPHVPHDRDVRERRGELLQQALTLRAARLDQVARTQASQRRVRHRRPHAVVRPREPVHEALGANRLEHVAARRGESERPVTTRRAFARDEDVGPHPPVIETEPTACAPEPGHHLVGDQQDAVPAAHLGHRRPVVVRGNRRGQGGTGHGLRDERGNVGRPDLPDRPVERLRVRRTAGERVRGHRAAVLVRRVDVREPAEPRLVRCAQRLLPSDVQRSDRIAVIRRRAPDDHRSCVLAPREVVRARELHRGLDRLAAAGDGVDPRVVHRQHGGDVVRVLLEGLGREHGSVHVWGSRGLDGHRFDEGPVPVPEAHDDRAAGGVQVALALRVLDPNALCVHGRRELAGQDAREDVAHERSLDPRSSGWSPRSRASRSARSRRARRMAATHSGSGSPLGSRPAGSSGAVSGSGSRSVTVASLTRTACPADRAPRG